MGLIDICHKFKIMGEVETIVPIEGGHINDTYLVTAKFGDTYYKYILQRINDYVFNNVESLMQNIYNVTEWLKNEILRDGGDPSRETLQLIQLDNGHEEYLYNDNGYYRMYNYIDNAVSLNKPRSAYDFSESSVAYARFVKRLASFPIQKLNIVIPNFHNTVKRMNSLKLAVKNDKMDRLHNVYEEVKWISEREKYAGRIATLLATHSIPTRVTHNDMKLSNVLIDNATGKGIAIIDLDTVMSGSLLYDFGDAIRFGCNTTVENETNLDKVHFNFGLYKIYTKTFVEEMSEYITTLEKKHLMYGAELMMYESAIRYLTDYLNGDLYFKTNYEDENLMRARTQMRLVESTEAQQADIIDWTLKL